MFNPVSGAGATQTQQPHARADGITSNNTEVGEEDQLRKSVREALGVSGSHDGQY